MVTTTATRTNPYVGPRSFTTGETLYGRDRETKKLLNLLIAERIVLLYSPSGAGKTSLVQAALLPRLVEEGFAVLPVIRVSAEPPPVSQSRANGTTDDALLRMLLDGAPSLALAGHNGHTSSAESSVLSPRPSVLSPQSSVLSPQPSSLNRYVLSVLLSLEEGLPAEQQMPLDQLMGMTLADYLGQRADAIDDADGVVVLFDQFEEILTIDPTDQAAKQEFFVQLGEALRDRRLWALIAMREDFLAPLDPYLRFLPTRLDTTFRLDLLEEKAARQAMQQPARKAGVTFADAAACALADDLRCVQVQRSDGTMEQQLGPYVEPVQLQVVCHRLWEQLSPDQIEIGVADVAAVGDVDSALTAYYVERVEAVAAATGISERAIRDWFDRQLITEQGIRGQVLQGAERSAGLDNRAIWPLIDAHVVRGEKRRGATWFELAHDRLIAPVRADNAAWREAHLSLLQRQAALWDQQSRSEGLLLRDAELDEAEAWAAAHGDALTPVEQDFLESCRKVREVILRTRRANMRIRRLAIVASVVGVIAVGLAIFGWIKWTEAVNAKNEADTAKNDALHQQALAEQQRQIAFVRQLAAASSEARERAPQQALLLAVEAISRTRGLSTTLMPGLESTLPGAEEVLHSALGTAGGVSIHHSKERGEYGFMISADGHYLVTLMYDSTTQQYGAIRRRDLADPAARLVEVPGQGQATVPTAISADGRYLLTQSFSSDISWVRWDLAETTPVSMTVPIKGFYGAMSDNGQYVVGRDDANLAWWDLTTTQGVSITLATSADADNISALALSGDGRSVVGGSSDGTLRRWDLTTTPAFSMTPAFSITLAKLTEAESISALALSGDGRSVVGGSSNGTLRRWDLTTTPAFSITLATPADAGSISTLAISPDGRDVVGGGADNIVRRWDVNDPTHPVSLRGQDAPATGVAFSADGRAVFGVILDGTVRRWDLTTPIADPLVLHSRTNDVSTVMFSQDGQYVVTGGYDGVDFWNTTSPTTSTDVLGGQRSSISLASLSLDGRYLVGSVTEGETSKLQRWDLTTPKVAPVMLGQASSFEGVYQMTYSSDGRYVIGVRDNKLELWDWSRPLTRTVVLDGQEATGLFRDLQSGQYVISVGKDGSDGQYVVSVGYDGTVLRWEITAPQVRLVKLNSTYKFRVARVRFSPDGRYLIVWGYDNVARWWDTQVPPAPPKLLPDQDQDFESYPQQEVAFSPGGQYLATVRRDLKTLRLWDIQNRTDIPLHGQDGVVTVMAFSPDNHYLATGAGPKDKIGNGAGADNMVRIWDLNNPAADPIVLSGHTRAIRSIAFNSDGRLLATADSDGTVRVWHLGRDELMAMACMVAGRNMTWEEWQKFMGEKMPYRKTCAKLGIDLSFVESGRELARRGDEDALAAAAKRFREANSLEPELNLNPEAEAQRASAPAEVERGENLARQGEIDQAVDTYDKAQHLDPELEISSDSWYTLCWQGSIRNKADRVLRACEQAIDKLPPGDEYYSHYYLRGRGLARALTKDRKGAADDFTSLVKWAEAQGYWSADELNKYNQWIAELQAGRDPIDDKVLKDLRDEQ